MALFLALTLLHHLIDGFRNGELRQRVAHLLGVSLADHTSNQMTYDLRRLCLKGKLARLFSRLEAALRENWGCDYRANRSAWTQFVDGDGSSELDHSCGYTSLQNRANLNRDWPGRLKTVISEHWDPCEYSVCQNDSQHCTLPLACCYPPSRLSRKAKCPWANHHKLPGKLR